MAQPVLFVHGAFCGGWAFDQFRQPFERAGYETHAPHLPFHERGSDLERLAQCSVSDFAAAIAHYAKGLGRPPVLVGHSMGGLVCQLAAAQTPCAGLILLGSSAPWGVMPTTLEEHGASFGLSLLGDYWRRTIPPDYRVARQSTLDRLPRDAARKIFARFVPESGRAIMETVQWWLDHAMASAAPVYRISCPILAIAGGQDRVNPTTTIRRLVGRFPKSQADYVPFDAMSHWLMGEEEWPQVAETALMWLVKKGIFADAAPPTTRRKPLQLFSWGFPPGA
ncbi:MAG: alpha/beta hydrolase [Alphaproteobacteria bacterium]|jgi:pimeloyl-ACP methyl ester carboxylesterase|nr:alpha/beta hydrolase [Alphaproteobacteria bacterium]